MKTAAAMILGLLVVCGGSGVFAEGGRWEGIHGREAAGGMAPGGERRELPRASPLPWPHRDLRDRDAAHEHEHEGGREHGRFPRHSEFIGVPLTIMPGYYYAFPQPDIAQAPQNFVEDGNVYWLYCPDLGYYPNVQVCPSGWLKAVPSP